MADTLRKQNPTNDGGSMCKSGEYISTGRLEMSAGSHRRLGGN